MKRVLIVSYFFPPISNMGSHRILRFVRHLREFGWEPVVLTGKLTCGPHCDQKLLEKLPADIAVERVECVDLTETWTKLTGRARRATPTSLAPAQPLKTQGVTTFLNRWVMIPDKIFPWIGPAARRGRQLEFDAIYSTSDPLSDHLVARRIARRTGRPWVAEFRDLWLGSPYFARSQPTPLHRAVQARMERGVVREASVVLCLSRGIQQYFDTTYPQCRTRTIYNCYDPDEYPAPAPPAEKFTVLYAGALYSSRSPAPFFAGWARFLAEQRPAAAEFVILGGSADLDLAAMARQHGVESSVVLAGRVSHAESLRRMQAATVLLTVQSPDDNVHVPGKLFEYIGARRPILAMSRPCEVAEMIAEHRLGWVAEPEAGAVAQRLGEAYAAWQARGHAGLAPQLPERFSIRETTRQLAGLLAEVSRPR